MSYIRGAATMATLILPLIILYKLWYGRGGFRDSIDDNNNRQQTSPTSLIDASSAMPDSADPSSSLALPSVEYEVFLSFRGPDTRHQFTDILYRFLCRTKIHTFKDDNELRKGEEIGSNLIKAIDQSKVYVPIISKSYADSKWCLIELAEIIRRQEQDARRIILPIFYTVNPNDVRHQTGPYQNAFQEHGKKFDENTIQSWKCALNKVGTLKGWHVKNNDELAGVLDEVSANIWSHLSKDLFNIDTDELVGIDNHIEVVVEKLSLDSKRVTMVGIHGMGGIGKTTVAKAVYNDIASRFDRCCFIENVRETQKQKDGVVVLQKRIVSEILRMDSIEFSHDSSGRKMIKERVSRFKVLVVLDDVDEKFRFEEILGSSKDFIPESRFMVTSRDKKVLSTLNENDCKLYEVGSMSHSQGLELFCKHAFKASCPPTDYASLAKNIVSTTGGLPLTLKVIGSLLFREDTSVWEEKLEQLHGTLELEVMDRLKISYDTLAYEAQQIFLDIACFFIGRGKDMPSYMWSSCNYYPASNINVLVQRSMIKISQDDKFEMHDQLRDMGREIVRTEDIEHPWTRSRIWSGAEGREVLSNRKGTSSVKGLRVHSYGIMDEFRSECFANVSELRYFEGRSLFFTGDFNNLMPNLRWLKLQPHPPVRQEDRPWTNFSMKNLVILDLHENSLPDKWGGWSQIKMAERLKVVNLSNSSMLRSLPCFPESLEVLNLRRNNHDQGVLDIGVLNNLKVLLLGYSKIRKICGGTFGTLKGLRKLDLANFRCENLREAVADISGLKSLKILSTVGVLKGVEYEAPVGLNELTTSSRISNLAELLELEVLDVYDCEDGFEFPLEEDNAVKWWKVSKLKSLSLAKTNVNISVSSSSSSSSNTSPVSLSRLPSSLISLKITHCPSVWLPSLENLVNLTSLNLSENNRLQLGVLDIGVLNKLKVLVLTNTKISSKVCGGTFGMLKELRELDLANFECKNLKEVFANIGELTSLRILSTKGVLNEAEYEAPTSLKELTTSSRISNLAELLELEELHVHDCENGFDFPLMDNAISKLKSLSVRMTNMNNIGASGSSNTTLPLLPSSLCSLKITGCRLVWLPSLQNLENLEFLTIHNCRTPVLYGIETMKSLRAFHITEVEGLTRIDGLGDLLSSIFCRLEMLAISSCPDLVEILPFELDVVRVILPSLKIMYIYGCRQLEVGPVIRGLSKFPLLRQLVLGSSKITSIYNDEDHVLRKAELGGLGSVCELVEMTLYYLPPSVVRIPSLAKLQKMETLRITCSPSLIEIEGLAELRSLKELNLSYCPSLERLWPADHHHQQVSAGLANLKVLDIRGCRSLRVDDLSVLGTSLPNVDIFWPIEDHDNDDDNENSGGYGDDEETNNEDSDNIDYDNNDDDEDDDVDEELDDDEDEELDHDGNEDNAMYISVIN